MNGRPKRFDRKKFPFRSFLKNLHVVLVRAENPVNIGQSARAMKNFGVSRLILVNCAPHKTPEAYTPGWKARDILDSAKQEEDLGRVTAQSSFSVGFTTRIGKRRGEARPFPEWLPRILDALRSKKVHLVFGNEKNGLSNEELEKCHAIAIIPANRDYSSLNLSHAVAVALYGIFSSSPEAIRAGEKPREVYPSPGELEIFSRRLLETLEAAGYGQSERDGFVFQIHEKMQRFFRKSAPDRRELHLFQSFLSRILRRIPAIKR
ncbi:MAG TPA: TrmH family RNA methyltransferase [Candidatus Omnitrophota bacterium]|nr:TrmH family RNA methyltransferase [Candidatus Omnitrophota bacterium]